MLPKSLVTTFIALASALGWAQQQPPVKVNVLNVCTPSADDQKEIAAALGKVPGKPTFLPDFEVSRGRSTLSDTSQLFQAGANTQVSPEPVMAAYVRIRRELGGQSAFTTVQYSFSADTKRMIETLVMHARDPKELVQVSIEDSASAVTSAASMLATSTPVERIKLERFGKASVVLARCAGAQAGPAPDQSAYEPLFRQASEIMGQYRGVLGARRMVPEELAKVITSGRGKAKSASPPASKRLNPR